MDFNNIEDQNGRANSLNLANDLQIYVVPSSLWDSSHNLVLGDIIHETIYVGFLRVNPEQTLSDLRIEMDTQLGYDVIPKEFVFCKSVGRYLSWVREKQETLLKAKHFLPPNINSPEIFVVDSIVCKRSQMSSRSNKTYASSYAGDFQDIEKGSVDGIILDDPSQHDQFKNLPRHLDEDTNIETKATIEQEYNVQPGRHSEIERLQNDILERHKELQRLENEHQQQVRNWELEDARRKEEEELRRKLYESMELGRRQHEEMIIMKQKKELEMLEGMLVEKQAVILDSEKHLDAERLKRDEIRQLKDKEMEYLKERVDENSKLDSNISDTIQQLHNNIKEMERRQKNLEEISIREREEAEAEFEAAQIEFERLRSIWDEEKRRRELEISERLRKEQQLREMFDKKQKEHEQCMEEERRKMMDERERALEIARERFEEEQRHWDEERIRYDDEEKRRLDEMTSEIQDAYNQRHVIPMFDINDPDLILENLSEFEQKNHLKALLKSVKAEREIEEKVRINAIQKVKSIQMKIQNRRNNIREVWKRKYLDEKKKSPPLEDQLNKYREELAEVRRHLLSVIESGMNEQSKLVRHPGVLNPSNKANLILLAFKLQQEMEDIHQKIDLSHMRLSTDRKLREQAETEVKMMKLEAAQNKTRLKKTLLEQNKIQTTIRTSEYKSIANAMSMSTGSLSSVTSANI